MTRWLWISALTLLSACMSQATIGKVMTGTGGVIAFIGALQITGALGGDCQENPPQTSCRSSGDSDRAAGVVALASGALLAGAGGLLWALDSSGDAKPKPLAQTTSWTLAPESDLDAGSP